MRLSSMSSLHYFQIRKVERGENFYRFVSGAIIDNNYLHFSRVIFLLCLPKLVN